MTETSTEVGFYGKLPFKGDFLQRRAPQEFVDGWDAWLQECMHASRRKLGDAWLDAYLTGPVWRFALDAGVCGSAAYAGIVVPSVDRVGRYFPLTVVARLADGCSLLDVACADGWFDAAERLVLSALEAEDLDIDAFEEQVAALREPLAPVTLARSPSLTGLIGASPFPRDSQCWHVPLDAASGLQHALNAVAYRELSRALQPLALWWTDGSAALGPAWLTTRGLPAAEAFAAMLTGEWTGSGWSSLAPAAEPAEAVIASQEAPAAAGE